ncbi:tRNA lysidine(34) synthetase TilS [Acinetobacter indicus]|uniref:tRNA lysidine(34) synthetase TilS n=1 Tax=Acinetobacter indicus TaxID=756892 RepID=UPI0013B073D7|nr:tRNA lysidine(34) synthetase TilS [Acinetobacter indicus]QIC74256.1 tRNA lysidine(34) synthetase TilS [Acinetobacter indicus]
MRSTLPAFDEVWQRQFRTGVLTQIQSFPEDTHFLIGCSGGMDSMLLLHLMAFLCPEKVRAIYIDHQLQPSSQAWGKFVQKYCQTFNIPCIIQAVQVAEGNLEQQARAARYQAFQQHIQTNEILVLAHHQQDQAETVLLRLFSGAGIPGLSAMKTFDSRPELSIWRPLLALSREQIQTWCQQLSIPHIQDPTNQDIHYDRAWCREQLWPLLNARFPKMQQSICRSSQLMQDAEQILTEVLLQDLASCGDAKHLDLHRIQQLSEARQRQLLSLWMKGGSQYRPSFDMVQRIQQEVIQARADAQAALHCNGFYYVRYQNVIYRLAQLEYLASQQAISAREQVCWQLGQTLDLPAGQFQLNAPHQVGLSFALLQQELTLSTRVGGEKIHLHGRVGAWPLKKAIQQAQIFPWKRHTIQILSRDNVMLGVFTPKGFWLADSAYCEPDGWQPTLIS